MTDYEPESDPSSSDEPGVPEGEIRAAFIPSRPGRMVSASGLVERVVEQFMIEHGEGESVAVREAGSDVERRSMVRDVALYVFGVEAVHLQPQEQAQIIAQAYSAIFGYGALDPLFRNRDVVTITLEGIQRIAVRYGPGEDLTVLEPVFDFLPEMRRMLQRLLMRAGAEWRPETPIIEAGLMVEGRRVCVTVAFPPYVSEIAADIRVHPARSITLSDLVTNGFMTEQAMRVIDALARSPHGCVVVGEPESGKTTLLGSMLSQIGTSSRMMTVERAGELSVPDGTVRLVPRWAAEAGDDLTFGEQILSALNAKPDVLVLDEVRADEPETITPLLKATDVPRMMWSLRGSSEPGRIRSALNMLARMADSSQPEAMVYQLYRRLPFVLVVRRRRNMLTLREIAEWQFPADASQSGLQYADYVPLLAMQADQLLPTGNLPACSLDLPEDFWC